MKYHHTAKITACLALGLHGLAFAGPAPVEPPPIEEPPANNGDWCDWLSSKPGILYKNKENPFIQEFQIEGRLQYQAAYVDGDDTAGNDWNETYDEYRRARLGVKAKFLQYFGVKYQVNLVSDGRPSGNDLDWGYQDIDEAYLSFNMAKAFGLSNFEKLDLIYGRQKFVLGHESNTSSTKLITVERSAIANKIYGSYRPTGATVKGETGAFDFATSVYSSTEDGSDNETFNGFQDSIIYLVRLGYTVNDALRIYADAVYNDADLNGSEDSIMSYEWATAIGFQYDGGIWGINGDFIYGDNGSQSNPDRGDKFYGLVLTPYVWIVEDKLQAVAQYQYQGSDADEGVRINSRYGRRAGSGAINSGRGDSHHSVYAGLNYYICKHNLKIQGGVEYQTMDTPDGDFDTLTYLIAFRSYF